MNKTDYHIHSRFSSDSIAEMEEVIEKAISAGYTAIAFSEHFDLVPSEIAIYGVPSYYQFTKAIARMRERYEGISILKGVELGEYHNCYEVVNKILSIDPPDVKIGAIHIIPVEVAGEAAFIQANISLPLKEKVSPSLIRAYYLENLRLVKYGNFDILAHLGVYKRYLPEHPDESCALDLIEETISLLIAKGITLEVNLSGLRKKLRSTVPDEKLLQIYRSMGGRMVAIGSDTHRLEDFDVFYEETAARLRGAGFEIAAF